MSTTNDWKRAHAELLRIAAERAELDHDEGRWLLAALRSRVHVRLGFATFVEYVERVLGYGPRVTEEKLRVAETLERLPAVGAALASNALSWSAVREITRVATPDTEQAWIDAARSRTVRDVERMVSGRRPGDTPSDPPSAEARRHVLRFEVSAETLATLREAMMKLRRDFDAPMDDDTAILLMARAVLGGPKDTGRASYQIAVTVCERCGAGTQRGKGESVAIAPEIVEMAACDAQHVSGGRATQTIPPATRREVVQRHGGCCAVPGCRNAVFIDIHHVKPRAEGGTHDPAGLVLLCSAHHRAQHQGRLVITGDADVGFTFRHADGSVYGRPDGDSSAKALSALRGLGFKHGESVRALADAHVGAGGSVEALLRAALARLGPRPLRVSDGARARYRRLATPTPARMIPFPGRRADTRRPVA